MILASGTKTGESVAKPVQKIWIDHDTDLLDLTVTDDHGAERVVHTTQHHPFWDVSTHTRVEAESLRVGEHLASSTAATVMVVAKTVVYGAAGMRDLTISDVHDFYITTGTTTASILVHNCPAAAAGAGTYRARPHG